jgi:AcrR family transcriptional regulator
MADEERRLRADAERNRRRLLDAAQILFREQGLEVGVGEIAKRAGVGRGTLFRNFPSKEHLVAAIVAERMRDAAVRGQELTDAEDPGGALFEFLEEIVGRQQVDRGLFEAVAEDFLANDEIREAYEEVVDTLDQLVARAKKVGAVREDVCGIDVLMMVKGVCESATAFSHINPRIVERQLDLVRAAISVPAASEPLRGPAPTVEDMALAFAGDPPATARGRARS